MSGNISAQTYTFSGGSGTTNDPYQISTAQDLLDLSEAVNFGSGYADKSYKMTADIDMSQEINGPFVQCVRKIYRSTSSNGSNPQEVGILTKISPVTSYSSDSYECARLNDDQYSETGEGNQTDNVTVSSTSTVTHYKNWARVKENTYYYRYEWTYSYYDAAQVLPISALMLPIGNQSAGESDGTQVVDNNVSVPFSGKFDGDNHTISHLTIVSTSRNVGLFGYVSAPSSSGVSTTYIKNLKITDANITTTSNRCGVLVGSFSWGTIENCEVTNSTVTAGYWVGSVVGMMVSSNSKSNGVVKNCKASDNTLTGDGGHDKSSVGGIVGYSADGESKVTDCTANNILNGRTKGIIVGSVGDCSGDCYEIEVIEHDDSDVANVLLNKNSVPDYCYINSGNAFDKTKSADAAKLAKLANELNGSVDITDNLVLPDYSDFENSFKVDISTLYSSTGRGLHWYFNTSEISASSLGLTSSQYTNAKRNISSTYLDDGVKLDSTKSGASWSYFFNAHGSKYNQVVTVYYENWPAELKNHVQKYYDDAVKSLIEEHVQYYKLTATDITIDQHNGGGILDKGNQLNGVNINFKRQFVTNNWNLEGYAQVGGELYVGYLGNNVDDNGQTHDVAALQYDYTNNAWTGGEDGYWKHSWGKTAYGEGLFVWMYDEERLEDYSNPTPGKPATGIHPVVTQKGNFVDYSTVDAALADYIQSLEVNGSANDDGYWFALANPYIARMDISKVIASLDNGTNSIQGSVLYNWNINESSASLTDWNSQSATNNLKGGQGFMVAKTSAGKLNGVFSKENLYGWNYVPGANFSSSDEGAKKSAKTKANGNSQKVVFIAIDKYNRAATASAVYGKGNNGFDNHDAYAMLSGSERHATEPYFTVENRDILSNAFSQLPYETPVNFHSDYEGEMTFAVTGNTDGLEITFIDIENGKETVMNDANVTVNLNEGENEGRYKIRFGAKSSSSINDVAQTQQSGVKIWNNNREINISGERLQRVDVMNMLGQTVYSKTISGEAYKFDLNAESGAYLIKVKSENGTKSEKVVVK